MDVTPIIPAGRQVIESYGASGFRVTGVAYGGSILVFPDRTIDWNVATLADVTAEALRPGIERGGIEILLLGCGPRMGAAPPPLPQALRSARTRVGPIEPGRP